MDTLFSSSTKGISASVLKNIAYIAMILDHTGYLLVSQYYYSKGLNPANMPLYSILRSIGRLAFPIFIFLLVEGYYKTKNKLNYIIRLLVFAVISEIPYNLVCSLKVINTLDKNVMFDLAICFALIWGIDACCNYFKERIVLKNVVNVLIIVGATALEVALGTDYYIMSIAVTLCFYLFRNDYSKLWVGLFIGLFIAAFLHFYLVFVPLFGWNLLEHGLLGTVISGSSTEMIAVLSLFPISWYNGKKGHQAPKFVYYLIYPAQFLILYAITSYLFF